jgi:t-SNARE complex subunit (syntaxin)
MNVTATLEFVRKNWKEILIIVCLLLVVGKMRYDYNQLEHAYETSQESLKEQIAGLQAIHKEEIRQRDEALNHYKEEIENIEHRHVRELEEFAELRDDTRKEFRNQFIRDPQRLADAIEDIFGFKHVE